MYNKHTPQHFENRAQAQAQGLKMYYGPSCKNQHDGLRYTGSASCVACLRVRSRSKYRCFTPQQKQAQIEKQRGTTPKKLWNSAQVRAIRLKRTFTITPDDIVIPDICPVLGTPMVSPSIDRFDNDKGYTPENIRVISNRANRIKSDATIEELEKILDYMKNSS